MNSLLLVSVSRLSVFGKLGCDRLGKIWTYLEVSGMVASMVVRSLTFEWGIWEWEERINFI